jgi:hypothetical protein
VLVTLWSVKGGSGTSTVAAGLAVVAAGASSPSRGSTLLVDLAGDQPALLGLARPTSPGALDWLAAEHGDADALRRLELAPEHGLALVPRGEALAWAPDRPARLVELLAVEDRTVVVDGGTLADRTASSSAGAELVRALAGVGPSLLVVRPCYLALRRVVALRSEPDAPLRPDGVVLVVEPGRALDATDVARAVGVPVRATVAVDPVVARAVDAGLLTSRVPRPFGRALSGLLSEIGA